jgi:hypothetical protein
MAGIKAGGAVQLGSSLAQEFEQVLVGVARIRRLPEAAA